MRKRPAVNSHRPWGACLAVCVMVSLSLSAQGQILSDMTDAGGTITASSQIGTAEGADKAFDNNVNTKWLTAPGEPTGWIQFEFPDGIQYAIEAYSITSANDAPDRDPRNFQLLGSNDGETWTVVDERSDEAWTARFQRRVFDIEPPFEAFNIYRLDVTANNGSSNLMGFSEMELLAPPDIFVMMTSPSSVDTFDLGVENPIVAEVQVLNMEKAVEKVDFFVNNQLIATQDTPDGMEYSATFTPPSIGTFNIVAIATDTDGTIWRSEAVTVHVEWDYVDVTDDDEGGTVTYSTQIHDGEGAARVFDNNLNTKWLTAGGNPTGWVAFIFTTGTAHAINAYSIASANDAPGRDPRDWTLEGSNDGGATWEVIDSRTDEAWTARFQRRFFFLDALAGPYNAYRLNVTRNNGDGNLMGFSELEFIRFESQPIAVDIVSPASGVWANVGHALTVSATADAGDEPIAEVKFFDGLRYIDSATTVTDGVYTVEWVPTEPGYRLVTAVAINEAGDAFDTLAPLMVNVPFFAAPDGEGDGMGWDTAASFETAYGAALASQRGAPVLLLEGEYVLSADLPDINNHISVYGGFAGDETQPAERVADYKNVHETIIDGAGAWKIFRHPTGQNRDVLLCGMTLRNAIGPFYAIGARNVTLRDLRFANNEALANVEHGPHRVVSLRSISNPAHIIRCEFIENGLNNENWGTLQVSGGQQYHITDSKFIGNHATDEAGAFSANGDPTAYLTNCLFANNTARRGGAIFKHNATIYGRNLTFSGNHSAEGGDAIFSQTGGATFWYNCLFEGSTTNTAITRVDNLGDAGQWVYVTQSLFADTDLSTTGTVNGITDGVALVGTNFNRSAGFVDVEAGNYDLDPDSPARDAGRAQFAGLPGMPDWSAPTADILGRPRNDGAIDIGAYETSGLRTVAVPYLEYHFEHTTGTVNSEGGIVTDLTGNGRHGMALSGEGGRYTDLLPPGAEEGGSLSGSEGILVADNSVITLAQLANAGGITLEAWATGGGPVQKIISVGNIVELSTVGDTGYQFENNYAGSRTAAVGTLDTGEWHHLVGVLSNVTMDGGTIHGLMSLFVNGELVDGPKPVSIWGQLGRRVSVGGHPSSDWDRFQGNIYNPKVTLGAVMPSLPDVATLEVPGAINFGAFPNDAPVTRTVAIRNVGGAELTVDAALTSPSAFAITAGESLALPGNDFTAQHIEVTFTPEGQTGDLATTLTLTTNDEASSTVVIPISAFAYVGGLIVHYQFDEDYTSPTAGQVAADASANALHGVYGGAAGPVLGGPGARPNLGTSAAFNGATDHVDLGVSPMLNSLSTNFTAAVWIHPNVVDRRMNIFGAATTNWRLAINNQQILYTALGIADVPSANVPGLVAGEWSHVALVVKPTGVEFYFNGELVSTAGAANSNTAANIAWSIGRLREGVEYFDGSLDDLRVYNTALSAEDIAALFGDVPATPTPEPTPSPTFTPTPEPTPIPPTPLPDADGDGKPDVCETTDPELLMAPNSVWTHALLPDTDGDGLLDGEEDPGDCEVMTTVPLAMTNPRNRDTDGDGIMDGVEVLILLTDPLDPNDPPDTTDSSGDGLPDYFVLELGQDINNPDWDGNGFSNAYELIMGSDPLDPDSMPALGDVNGDGVQNNTDAALLYNMALGYVNGEEMHLGNADLNADGVINNLDGVILHHWLLGNIPLLPHYSN